MKKKKLNISLDKALTNFTLAKFCGAMTAIIILATVKYLITGDFHIEFSNYWNNIGFGLLGWTINTGIIGLLTEYLGIKGININLNQLIYGFDTMKTGDTSSTPFVEDTKPKLYNAMDSGESSNSGKKSGSSKGGFRNGGRDVRVHPYPRDGRRAVRSWTFDDESDNGSDNGSNQGNNPDSGSDTEMEGGPSNRNKSKKLTPFSVSEASTVAEPKHNKGLLLDKGNANLGLPADSMDKGKAIEAPFFSIFSKVSPYLDATSLPSPEKLNPGPGFNVPGGEVPLRDEICQHIDYNGHILNQFKTMDWDTAHVQRRNYMLNIQYMAARIAHAEGALSKIPTIPTNDQEFMLRNKILSDIESLSKIKVRSEARIALLESRLNFIHASYNQNNN